jgi:hypothetical protein
LGERLSFGRVLLATVAAVLLSKEPCWLEGGACMFDDYLSDDVLMNWSHPLPQAESCEREGDMRECGALYLKIIGETPTSPQKLTAELFFARHIARFTLGVWPRPGLPSLVTHVEAIGGLVAEARAAGRLAAEDEERARKVLRYLSDRAFLTWVVSREDELVPPIRTYYTAMLRAFPSGPEHDRSELRFAQFKVMHEEPDAAQASGLLQVRVAEPAFSKTRLGAELRRWLSRYKH